MSRTQTILVAVLVAALLPLIWFVQIQFVGPYFQKRPQPRSDPISIVHAAATPTAISAPPDMGERISVVRNMFENPRFGGFVFQDNSRGKDETFFGLSEPLSSIIHLNGSGDRCRKFSFVIVNGPKTTPAQAIRAVTVKHAYVASLFDDDHGILDRLGAIADQDDPPPIIWEGRKLTHSIHRSSGMTWLTIEPAGD